MNKTMAYTAAALAALSALTGCGRMEDAGNTTRPTEYPAVSASPALVTPDPADGFVRDEDGIITDDDTGRDTNGANTTARPTADPGMTGGGTVGNPNGAAPKGERTASPSPSASAGTGTGMQ